MSPTSQPQILPNLTPGLPRRQRGSPTLVTRFVEQCCWWQRQLEPELGRDWSQRLLLQVTLQLLLRSPYLRGKQVVDRFCPPFLEDCPPIKSEILQALQNHPFSLQEAEPNAITPAILGTLLERFRGEGDRKAQGIFYTPPSIAADLVISGLRYYLSRDGELPRHQIEELLRDKPVSLSADLVETLDQKLATIKVCDPAIGAGAFAGAMVQAIAHLRHQLTHHPLALLRCHTLTHSIYGMDTDELAIAVSRVRLALACLPAADDALWSSLEQHLRCGNALLQAHPNQPFDLVTANPPYVPIQQIDWQERRHYEQQFFSARGRFNLFYLFLEQSQRWTKPGGICAFLVPDRLLLNTQCQALRLWLLQHQTLLEIKTFATSPEIVVDQVAVVYQNQAAPQASVQVQIDHHPKQSRTIPLSYFLRSPHSRIDFNYHPLTLSIQEKLRQASVELGAIAQIKDGIIQGKVADCLFLQEPSNEHCRKLLFGRDVERYRISFRHWWVNYNPAAMLALEQQRRGPGVRPGLWLRQPEVFERPKILTRQTADRIIAAFDTDHYYYANTLHGITVTDPTYNPLAVLAVLNSRLLTWYYRTITAEQGKVFAQIKIAVLRQLPIPLPGQAEQTELAQMAQQLMGLAENSTRDQFVQCQEGGDRLLYQFYGLTPEEIALVEASA